MLEQVKTLLWKNITVYRRDGYGWKLVILPMVVYLIVAWSTKPKVEISASRSPPKLLHFPLSQISKMRLPYVPKSPATDNLMRFIRTTSGVGETIAFQDWEAADKNLTSDKDRSERFPLAYFKNVESNSTKYVTPLNILIATAFINYHRIRDGDVWLFISKCCLIWQLVAVKVTLKGNPHFILLDEPTTGIDPAARRVIWNIFRDIRSAGKTIIMTSHSMEECEALCTRLAIMVTGRFRCIGSLQHLKNKFTQGLSITVKMGSGAATEDENASFLNFVKQSFPDSLVINNRYDYVHFLVLEKDIKWSTVFQTMETAKEKFSLFNYSVQQTTLEQIFLRLVTDDNPPVCGKTSWKQKFLKCCK